MADVLHDDVHVDAGVGDRSEDRVGDARLVGNRVNGDLGLVALHRNARNDCLFHGHVRVILESNQSAGLRLLLHRNLRIGEAGEHARRHLVFACEFHRADLQHPGAGARHLEHFLEADGVQAPRFGDYARIRGVDTVDIGVDLALVGAQGGRERHRRGVGAAAAQRGDVALRVHALETGDHRDAAVLEVLPQAHFVDRDDARAVISRIGQHSYLPAGIAARLDAQREQRHREQAHRHLLAGGRDDIEFTRVWVLLYAGRERQQPVRLAGHGRGHDHDAMPGCLPLGDAPRDIADALDGAYRSAAEFLDDQSHAGRGKVGVAESEGFEPPSPCGLTVFKTVAFDRSANSP